MAKTTILDENEIFSDEDIKLTVFSEAYIGSIFEGNQQRNEFLAKAKIIKNSQNCARCEGSPSLRYVKDTSYIDGFRCRCNRPCRFSRSVRADSFFEASKYKFKEIFLICTKYLKGDTFDDIAWEIKRDLDSVSKITDLIREAICYFTVLRSERIGGINPDGSKKIVEIDESLFFKRKYNRGRIRDEQWYVGGIERSSRKCFIVPVENRNAVTMIRIIQDYVNPGSIIITDKWRAYQRALSELENFEHLSINHSLNFVDPNDPLVHTQNVEGLWSRSKYYIRKKRHF
jgi:transposase-like protein